MRFSELTKDWYWLTCCLCNNEVVIIKDKIEHEEDVLCGACILIELKMESLTIELENENRNKKN